MKKCLLLLSAAMTLLSAQAAPPARKTAASEHSPSYRLISQAPMRAAGTSSRLNHHLRTRGTLPGALTTPRLSAKSPLLAPAQVTPLGAELRGLMVYDDAWGEVNKAGIYKVPVNSFTSLEPVFLNEDLYTGAFRTDGKIYVPYLQTFMGYIFGSTLTIIDEATGETLSSSNFTTDFQVLNSVWIESKGAALGYAVDMKADGYALVTITPAGTVNKVQDLGTTTDMGGGLTVTADGKIYGMGVNGALYSVDPSNYAPTLLGMTSATDGYYISAIAYDEHNGVIYYPSCPETAPGHLYSINPVTLEAVQRYQYPTNCEFGMFYVSEPKADYSAPAEPSELVASFADGSLSGTFTFLPPTVTYGGVAGSGSLTYTVTLDGATLTTGSTSFGAAAVSVPVTVPASGEHTLGVFCSNSAGAGPEASTSLYIGLDSPAMVKDVALSRTGGKLNLSWAAVTGEHGAFIDQEKVSYTVTRYVNNKATATQTTKALSLSEDYPDPTTGLEMIYYTVQATYEGNTSAESKSNMITLGYILPPYQADLSSAETAASSFNVIDNNADGCTWKYYTTRAVPCMGYNYSSALDADDYLVLPPAQLEAGKIYYFSFAAGLANVDYRENIAAYVGKQATAAGLNVELLPSTELTTLLTVDADGNLVADKFSLPFTPAESGIYYFALKATSPADRFNLYVCDIAISAPFSAGAPGAVTSLVITPDATGANKATLNFTAPSKTLGGATLTSLERINIYRDGELIDAVPASPGQKLSYVDEYSRNGEVTYKLVPVNADGEGEPAEAKVFVGFNVPCAAEDATAKFGADNGEVILSWTPVTKDINGLTLPDVSYTVVQYVNQSWVPVSDKLTDTSITLRVCSPEATQSMQQFGVIPSNAAGNGQGTSAGVICVGKPYTMPYTESFELEKILYMMTIQGQASWTPCNDATYSDLSSADADDAFIVFKASSAGDSSCLVTGRISIDASASNPAFSYYYYCLGDDDLNEFQVLAHDGEGWNRVGASKVAATGNPGEWTKVTVDFSAYKGKTIQIALQATAINSSVAAIDMMRLADLAEHDISVELRSGDSAVAGQKFPVTAVVSNNGALPEENYSVDLIVNYQCVASQYGTQLQSGASRSFIFEYEVPATADESMNIAVRVNTNADADWSNNSSEAKTIAITRSDLPAVDDLQGSLSAAGVELSWTEPDYSGYSMAVTESFENAESFANMNGGNTLGWRFLDLDGCGVGGFENNDIPGITVGQPSSFFIFDSNFFNGNKYFLGHNGSTKYLAALFNYEGQQCDDWAISPELSGQAQKISFYARAYSPEYPETIELLYSTSDDDPESFVSVKTIKGITTDENLGWTLYDFDVPAGAKYFAIRFVSTDTFMLMIDDVTFVPAGAQALTLVGYNVYRNDIKLNDAPLSTTSFTDPEEVADARYIVTAVYGNGESAASNAVYPRGNGIDEIGGALSVSGLKGEISISGAQAPASVFDMSGRLIYAGDAQKVPAPAGIYLVKIGRATFKVIVK